MNKTETAILQIIKELIICRNKTEKKEMLISELKKKNIYNEESHNEGIRILKEKGFLKEDGDSLILDIEGSDNSSSSSEIELAKNVIMSVFTTTANASCLLLHDFNNCIITNLNAALTLKKFRQALCELEKDGFITNKRDCYYLQPKGRAAYFE